MTIHNALKGRPQLYAAFGDLLGLGNEEEGTVRLGESLTPIIDVWQQPEAALLRDEILFGGAVFSTAVAAELSFGGIRNHAASNKIMIVERFEISAAAATLVAFTVLIESATDVDTTTAVRPRDTRWVNTPGFVMPSGAAAATLGDIFWRQAIPAGGLASCPPFVLHPGRELRAYGGTVNSAVVVCASGRVRVRTRPEIVNK